MKMKMEFKGLVYSSTSKEGSTEDVTINEASLDLELTTSELIKILNDMPKNVKEVITEIANIKPEEVKEVLNTNEKQ